MLIGAGDIQMNHTIRTADLKRMLTDRRREVRSDIRSRVRGTRRDGSSDVREELERAEARTQGDIELALVQASLQTVARIDAALVRLDAGSTGPVSSAPVKSRSGACAPCRSRCVVRHVKSAANRTTAESKHPSRRAATCRTPWICSVPDPGAPRTLLRCGNPSRPQGDHDARKASEGPGASCAEDRR